MTDYFISYDDYVPDPILSHLIKWSFTLDHNNLNGNDDHFIEVQDYGLWCFRCFRAASVKYNALL